MRSGEIGMRMGTRDIAVTLRRVVAFGLLIAFLLDTAAGAADFRFSRRPNKADLIQWREWSAHAFGEAKKQDKLILLSLSAVWCHWCHVMDETTYSDDEVIRILNERFIPVRVDADIRPDIDSLYNQGGWPSTVILTPDGEVIDGGNYLPPEEMKDRLGRAVALFAGERDKIVKRMEAIKQRRTMMQRGMTSTPGQADVTAIVAMLKDSFDEKNGGFGSGQKFPNPDAMDFLLVFPKDPAARRIVTLTLDRMAQGEVYDRIEGGFFRYATKPDWAEPHYEKMLEVNAGLIRSYANAYRALGTERYRRIARESIRYVENNLYDRKSGALFGSQDADEAYYRTQDRKRNAAPAVDRTVYADTASLMVSALVAAGEAMGERQYLQMATKAADHVIKNLYRPADGLFHSFRDGRAALSGRLNDNALFGSALLDLYSATGERRHLDRAGSVAQVIMGRFYDPKTKRFRTSIVPLGVDPLTPGILAERDEGAANCRAANFLARFSRYSRDRMVKDAVTAVLTTYSAFYRGHVPQAPAYGSTLRWAMNDPMEVVILADGGRVTEYLAAAGRVFVPEKVVRVLSLVEDREEIKSYGYKARESVYLCAGKRCSKPIADPGKLRGEIRHFLETPDSDPGRS